MNIEKRVRIMRKLLQIENGALRTHGGAFHKDPILSSNESQQYCLMQILGEVQTIATSIMDIQELEDGTK